MRIGIDVGGTFTDVILADDARGTITCAKALTTPRDPTSGVLAGIDKVLAAAGAQARDLRTIVHGTTIGTNALIEGKVARTGLITTEGFRDVLDIARIERPAAGLYDMSVDLPDPLVRRKLRCEVVERVGASGEVVTALDEESVRRAARYLRDEGVEAIAVCLLFSFKNPAHERRVAEICREVHPRAFVSLSSEIAPEFREYERSSTTVIDACLQPIVLRYLDELGRRVAERYGSVDLHIMQASGGVKPLEAARRHTIGTINSGPAGGVVASATVGRLLGEAKLVGVDMGGTSFDIGLVLDGRPRIVSEGEIEGYPVKLAMADVNAIGAGGGSIAWIDRGGALNVGPQSAAAEPGPACYARGGVEPTVTDANVVLGRIDPAYFLGGDMRLDPELARRAIDTRVAGPLGLSLEKAADGVLRVVAANMVKGIGVSVIQKGHDVREFALLAFGGAGPLHAVELADLLGMKLVIIPPFPGAFSALGLLYSDIRHDYVRTLALMEKEATAEALGEAFADLERRGREQLRAERVGEDAIEIVWSADLRYEGQSYWIDTPVERRSPLRAEDVAAMVGRFHDLHRTIYHYSSVDEGVEVVSVRVAAIGKVPQPALPRLPRTGPDPRAARKGSRKAWFSGPGWVECPVFERSRLAPGNEIEGPCLVEEMASVTVVPPRTSGTVDEYGCVAIRIE